jgi:hypothetical protein
VHLILVAYPNLLRDTVRVCCADNADLVETAPLPASFSWPAGSRSALRGSYGAYPPDLNNDEAAFAELLDSDLSGTVEWWHRNEDRKPWSAGLVLPNGKHYYPDFIVKAAGRDRGDGLLLVEVKGEYLLNSMNTPDKAVASHKLYRRPLMVAREASGRWMTLRFNERTAKVEFDSVFRIEALPEY